MASTSTSSSIRCSLVERDDADGIRRVAPFSDRLDGHADESLVGEAWTQIEIDRVDDELAAELELELEAAVADVRRVVGDFGRDARPPARTGRTSTRRCSGSPTASSSSSAPWTRRATSPARVTPIEGTALGQLADADAVGARGVHVLDLDGAGANARR